MQSVGTAAPRSLIPINGCHRHGVALSHPGGSFRFRRFRVPPPTRLKRKPSPMSDEQHGYHFEDLSVGMSAVYGKTVTDADIAAFAGVSGDTNPVHLDDEFAGASCTVYMPCTVASPGRNATGWVTGMSRSSG